MISWNHTVYDLVLVSVHLIFIACLVFVFFLSTPHFLVAEQKNRETQCPRISHREEVVAEADVEGVDHLMLEVIIIATNLSF